LLEQVLYVSTQNQVKIGPCIHITLKKCKQFVYSSITNYTQLQTMLIFSIPYFKTRGLNARHLMNQHIQIPKHSHHDQIPFFFFSFMVCGMKDKTKKKEE